MNDGYKLVENYVCCICKITPRDNSCDDSAPPGIFSFFFLVKVVAFSALDTSTADDNGHYILGVP